MYERMLNKQASPTMEEMTEFCGKNAERFSLLNEWLTSTFNTDQKVVFPYGNNYGWGVAHKKKNKLICNVFAEDNAFTVMMRLSDKQYTQEYIDNKYSCGDGGWIHYRVICKENFYDIKVLLSVKCSKQLCHGLSVERGTFQHCFPDESSRMMLSAVGRFAF